MKSKIKYTLAISFILVLTGCAHPDSIQSTVEAEIKVCEDFEAGKISAEEGLRLQDKIRSDASFKYGNSLRAMRKYNVFMDSYNEHDCLKPYRLYKNPYYYSTRYKNY